VDYSDDNGISDDGSDTTEGKDGEFPLLDLIDVIWVQISPASPTISNGSSCFGTKRNDTGWIAKLERNPNFAPQTSVSAEWSTCDVLADTTNRLRVTPRASGATL
jgi:hypothetical protein